ncbi:MAG: HlyD family efflux transporter periplasmic adaptor subunit [Verrucomicrobia bacterium]|nr:HlyD family efflux transporter periplasmic adaptor subunit [Verrucomicrobiota bacterium]
MSELHPSAPTLRKGRRSHRIRQVIDHWPLLVWAAVLAIAVFGYSQGIVFDRMNGAVDVQPEEIAPTEDGRFLSLGNGIKIGMPVADGDEIGRMDPSMIELDISRFEARLRLRGQGDGEKSHERLVELRRDQLDAAEELKLVENELQGLEKELTFLKNAQLPPAVVEDRRRKVEFEIELLKLRRNSQSEKNDVLIAAVKERTEILKKATDGEGVEHPMDEDDAERLEMMNLRKENLILKTNRAGIVDRILKEPGEFVKAGEAIAKVVADPTHIWGFLPQQEVTAVRAGDEVWITSAIDRFTTFKSTVLNLAPRIDNVRDSASPLPNQAVRGRTILVDYPKESGFLPGQPVIIHLKKPGELSLMTKFFNLFRR